MKSWYAAVVWPNRERRVARALPARARHLGVPDVGRTLVPMLARRATGEDGKTRTRLLVAMPGYVLVEMEPTAEAVRLVRGTSGVRGFAGTRSWEPRELVPIPEGEVEALARLAWTPAQEAFDPRAGETVRVRSGPLRDHAGTVVELLPRGRALVSLSLASRAVPVEIPISLLEGDAT